MCWVLPAAQAMRTALFDKGWVDYAVDGVYCEEAKRAAGFFDTDGKTDGKREPDGGAPASQDQGRVLVPSGKSDAGGWDASVLVRRRGTLVLPVDVELTFVDGTTRLEHWDGEGDAKRFDFHGPVALRGAVVDPQGRVLIDRNLENNHGVASGHQSGAWRTLERAAYFAQLAIQAVSP